MRVSQNDGNYGSLSLPPQRIDLWIVKPEEIQDADLLRAYHALLSPGEQRKIKSFSSEKHRHSALITRAMNRTVLSAYQDKAPEQWQFELNQYGKPEVINGQLPLRFNLSHTRGLIICGVTLNHNLGVDVEDMTRSHNLSEIARCYFAPEEIRQLDNTQESDLASQFFNFWTLKESYIKAQGKGLSIPLNSFAFELPGTSHDAIRLSMAPQPDQKKSQQDDWQSWLFQGSVTHRIAINIQAPIHQIYQIRFFSGIPLQSFASVQLPRIA